MAQLSTAKAVPQIFISYARGVDEPAARQIASDLRVLVRPWHRLSRGRLNVWIDQINIESNAAAWPDIESQLRASTSLVLIASPRSASRPGVTRELEIWQSLGKPPPLLLCLEGDIVWNDSINDFDWEQTTALPRVLSGVWTTRPAWADIGPRNEMSAAEHQLSDDRFLNSVAGLAAVATGQTREAVIAKYVGERRKSLTVLSGLSTTLSVVAIFAVVNYWDAIQQARIAEAEAASSKSLAILRSSDPAVGDVFDAAESAIRGFESVQSPATRQAAQLVHESIPQGLLRIARTQAALERLELGPRGSVWGQSSTNSLIRFDRDRPLDSNSLKATSVEIGLANFSTFVLGGDGNPALVSRQILRNGVKTRIPDKFGFPTSAINIGNEIFIGTLQGYLLRVDVSGRVTECARPFDDALSFMATIPRSNVILYGGNAAKAFRINAQTCQQLLVKRLPKASGSSQGIAPLTNGLIVMAASDQLVVLNSALTPLDVRRDLAPIESVISLPSGVAVGTTDGRVKLFGVDEMSQLQQTATSPVLIPGRITALAYDDQKQWLYVGGRHGNNVSDSLPGELLRVSIDGQSSRPTFLSVISKVGSANRFAIRAASTDLAGMSLVYADGKVERFIKSSGTIELFAAKQPAVQLIASSENATAIVRIDNTIQIIDHQSQAIDHLMAPDQFHALRIYDRDLVAASRQGLHVFRQGKWSPTIRVEDIRPQYSAGLSVDRTGKYIAIGKFRGVEIRRYDNPAETLCEHAIEGGTAAVQFAHDGDLLAVSSSNGEVELYELGASCWTKRASLDTNAGSVIPYLAVSQVQNRVLGQNLSPFGRLRMWNAESGLTVGSYRLPNNAQSLGARIQEDHVVIAGWGSKQLVEIPLGGKALLGGLQLHLGTSKE